MQSESYDVHWLDHSQPVSMKDLTDLSGLTEIDIHELVDLGVLRPVDGNEIPWVFSADCIVTMRTACRLRVDLELDSHAVALALTLLKQIRSLEVELAQLRARQPMFTSD